MQVDIMLWFQGLFENFTEFFDVFFAFITFFGEELLILIILPICYWAIDKKLGTYLCVASFATLTVNGAVKDVAQIERPIFHEAIRYVEIENFFVDTVGLKGSYSFPSGHSQGIATLAFGIGCYFNKKKIWISAVTLTLLVMLSRMYLGVHWPLDVLVGGLLGAIIAVACYKVFTKLNEPNKIKFYIIAALVSLVVLLFAKSDDTYKAVGALVGFALGALFENKLVNFDPKQGTVLKKVLRCVIGLIAVLVIRIGLKEVFGLIGEYQLLGFLRYLIMVFFGFGVYPLIFKKANL